MNNLLAADTYDIILRYEDGVLSISKWVIIIIITAVFLIAVRT